MDPASSPLRTGSPRPRRSSGCRRRSRAETKLARDVTWNLFGKGAELARDAIAHEEEAPGGKVKMAFRVVLADAEALVVRTVREEKNLEALVTEFLEVAARPARQ
jgi:hypothetical protein